MSVYVLDVLGSLKKQSLEDSKVRPSLHDNGRPHMKAVPAGKHVRTSRRLWCSEEKVRYMHTHESSPQNYPKRDCVAHGAIGRGQAKSCGTLWDHEKLILSPAVWWRGLLGEPLGGDRASKEHRLLQGTPGRGLTLRRTP